MHLKNNFSGPIYDRAQTCKVFISYLKACFVIIDSHFTSHNTKSGTSWRTSQNMQQVNLSKLSVILRTSTSCISSVTTLETTFRQLKKKIIITRDRHIL